MSQPILTRYAWQFTIRLRRLPLQRIHRVAQGRVRMLALLLLIVLVRPAALAGQPNQEIRFGILSLFHASKLNLEQGSQQVISVAETGATSTSMLTLNGEPGHRQMQFRAQGNQVIVGARSAPSWTATARDGAPVAFQLTVPGKFHRAYLARLTIKAHNGELLAIAAIDRETAVASIVASELDESVPMEALKAQSVATRSFLVGGPRHQEFDFCDTTHCQFLKSPPPPASRVWTAVQETRGLIIEFRGKPLAAMYSSRCGGRTRSMRDVGMDPGDEYPYYAATCVWCRRHPLTWRSRIDSSGKIPNPGDERQRIAQARQWGWGAIPGSDFTAVRDESGWRLEGHSVGHGVGLCQFGAVGMASSGSTFREILSHYYPNTVLTSWK